MNFIEVVEESMKLKGKIKLSSFFLLLSLIINLWFSANLHNLMTKK